MKRLSDQLGVGNLSARGWGYQLEGEGLITKAEIDYVEDLVNKCRKKGYLPLDFTLQDESRTFHCVDRHDFKEHEEPERWLRKRLEYTLDPVGYDISFWESQDYFIQALVEKIDLRNLFEPICDEYNIPIATAKGWSTITQRGLIASRFYYWQQRGKIPVLLYCGDFDPAGQLISEKLKKNLADLEDAKIPAQDGGYFTGWTPEDVKVHRFGLNYEQIQEADLTWIENLVTGSKKDLADPSHPDHDREYVQNWLDNYGARKVEANALVKEPQYARKMFRDVLERYLGSSPKGDYDSELESERKQIKTKLSEMDLEEPIRKAVQNL